MFSFTRINRSLSASLTLVVAECRTLIGRRLAALALVFLLVVPAGYTGLLLWVNHDPYNNLSHIPAALIVDDVGAKVNGVATNYGHDVAETVTRAKKFDWHSTTAAEAAAGLKSGKYDFTIELPTTFSATVASTLQNLTPVSARRATIVLTTNDAASYTTSSIARQAANTIADALALQIRVGSVTGLLTQLAGVRSGLVSVVQGTASLSSASTKIASGSAELATGAGKLRDGATRLETGMAALQSATRQLPAQAAALATAAQQVAAGNASAAAAGQKAVALIGSETIAQRKADLLSELSADGLTPDEVDRVSARLDPMMADAAAAQSQMRTVSGQLNSLSTASSLVAGGMQKVSTEAPTLARGVAAAATGAAALATGARSLSTGSSTLATATKKAGLATATIHDSLRDGLHKLPAVSAANRALRAKTAASPVTVKAMALTTAGNLGAGLAPYFISLGAWIGVYSLFLVIRATARTTRPTRTARIRNAVSGWLLASALGAVQMVLVLIIVAVTLQVRVDLPLATLGFMVLASASFAAILRALTITFGRFGNYLGVGLLLVQLVTAGGTLPWQTLPGPLAFIHTALPMSSAVDGLRQLMYGGSVQTALADAQQLSLWLVAALLVAVVAAGRPAKAFDLGFAGSGASSLELN